MTTSVTLIGATGLTGSVTLSSLLASTHPVAITTLTRRAVPGSPSRPTTTLDSRTYPDLTTALTGKRLLHAGLALSCHTASSLLRGASSSS